MTRIRVLFDATWADATGGTARYTRSLQAALANEPSVDIISVSAPRLRTGPRLVRLLLNGGVHLGWTQIVLPMLALVRRADVVQTSMTAPVWCPRPVVLTLHDALDFLPELRPSRIWSAYMRTVGAVAARRATAVLTGTRASAAEITRWYRLDAGRVHVTPYGSALVGVEADPESDASCCQPERRPPFVILSESEGSLLVDSSGWCKRDPSLSLRMTKGEEGQADSPYVLLVGAADRRKDLGTGLRAVELTRRGGFELRAVVVGGVPERYASAAWVSVLAGVSDGVLAQLYAKALAVIVPSRHEGFGLPVVEALAVGTPVIVSDLPALREAGGEAALYAPVGDSESFARELTAIAVDPLAARQRVAMQATRQVKTWADTARSTVAVYRDVLGHCQ